MLMKKDTLNCMKIQKKEEFKLAGTVNKRIITNVPVITVEKGNEITLIVDQMVYPFKYSIKKGDLRYIIDPKTGQPAKGHKAVWVSHISAAWADALSTAFMVMTTEQVEEYCSQNPAVWALVVKDAGKCKIYNRKAVNSK